jgi:hypothetical protein
VDSALNKFAGAGISYATVATVFDNQASQCWFCPEREGRQKYQFQQRRAEGTVQHIVYKEFFCSCAEYEVTNAQLIDFDANSGYFKYNRTGPRRWQHWLPLVPGPECGC